MEKSRPLTAEELAALPELPEPCWRSSPHEPHEAFFGAETERGAVDVRRGRCPGRREPKR